MQLNLSTQICHGLNALTYNGDALSPIDSHPNIYMGLGLWSVKDGLSQGLPVDVMQMLLAAALMRLKTMASSPIPCKVVILIADSMAEREGAEREAIQRITSIYRESLTALLNTLKLDYEILLASEIEITKEFGAALAKVDSSPLMQTIIRTDSLHCRYIRSETAISLYMHDYLKVGIKVGWMEKSAGEAFLKKSDLCSAGTWNERRFDRLFDAISHGTSLQYLYARAGLKQRAYGKQVNIKEGCPYTAYPEDRRYVIQTERMQELKAVSYVKKKTGAHWQEVAAVCDGLIQAEAAYPELLPIDCLQKNNVRGTVYRMLNHWVNAPVCLPAATPIRHDIPEQITAERYYEEPLYQDDSTIAYKPRYVLL